MPKCRSGPDSPTVIPCFHLRPFKPDTSAIRVEFGSGYLECGLDCAQCRAFRVRAVLDVVHSRCRDTGLLSKLRLGNRAIARPARIWSMVIILPLN